MRDTTADDIREGTPPPFPTVRVNPAYGGYVPGTSAYLALQSPVAILDQEDTDEDMISQQSSDDDEEEDECQEEDEVEEDEDDDEDDEIASVGVELNQRLLAATAARQQGEQVPLDEEWEQWLKEAAERGNGSSAQEIIESLNATSNSLLNTASHAVAALSDELVIVDGSRARQTGRAM